jgi:GH35 family endo-1,4-beta-xylanase
VGEDFVLQAFRLARKYAQPNVKLFYNDYSTFIPKKREYIESLILKPLMAENLVDGMGMQSHLMLKYHDLTEYEKSLKAYAALGVEIHITELDIHNPDPSEEGQEQMALMYKQLFNILVKAQKEDGANITSVTFWGMKDDESWLTGFRKEKSYPLLFGENYDLKPAYFAVADVPEHI